MNSCSKASICKYDATIKAPVINNSHHSILNKNQLLMKTPDMKTVILLFALLALVIKKFLPYCYHVVYSL